MFVDIYHLATRLFFAGVDDFFVTESRLLPLEFVLACLLD